MALPGTMVGHPIGKRGQTGDGPGNARVRVELAETAAPHPAAGEGQQQ